MSLKPTRRRIPEAVLKQVGAAAGWRCGACGELLSSVFELDHRVPLHKGGTDAAENLQPLCCQCHALKTQRERLKRMHERQEAVAEAAAAAAAAAASTATPPGTKPKRKRLSQQHHEAETHEEFLHNRFLRFAFVSRRPVS